MHTLTCGNGLKRWKRVVTERRRNSHAPSARPEVRRGGCLTLNCRTGAGRSVMDKTWLVLGGFGGSGPLYRVPPWRTPLRRDLAATR